MWDGLFLGAGELLMRQPGIVGLHSLTTLNALHYAYRATGDDATRAVHAPPGRAFVPLFRDAMKSRGKVERREDRRAGAGRRQDADFTAGDVFADAVDRTRTTAARMALTFLQGNPAGEKESDRRGPAADLPEGHATRTTTSSARRCWRTPRYIAPAWRNRFLAASLFWLKGAGAPDSPLVERTRAALA